MPIPLSRILISTVSPRSRVEAVTVGAKPGSALSAFRLAIVEAVRDQVQEHARDLLRVDVGLAGLRVEALLDRDVEAGLLGSRPMIGEVQALLDERVDVRKAPLARALARVQQHVLHD